MSAEEKLIDYAVEDAEAQEKCHDFVFTGLKNYANSDDYKLLAQYDPQLAAALLKPDLTLKFGAAPLIQILKFKGLAWGERYHRTSDGTRIVDANIRAPFETDPYVFLLNSDKVSRSTLSTALKFYSMEISEYKVHDFSEKQLKRILKSAGENALEEMVEGWSNVYTSLERNTDVEYVELSEKKYLYINPVYAMIPDGKRVEEIPIGYIGAKDTVDFYPYLLGQKAKNISDYSKRKKKITAGVLSTIAALIIAAIVAIFLFMK